MNRDDIDNLPEGSASDHAFVWSLGDMHHGVIVEDWKTCALEMEVRVTGIDKSTRLPVVILEVVGMQPGASINTKKTHLIMFPVDVAEKVGPALVEYVEKIRRNNRARIVANGDPPKEAL